MAFTLSSKSSAGVCAASRSSCRARRCTVVVRAVSQDAQPVASRRELISAAALACATVVASPAHAFLGFAEDDTKLKQTYNDNTSNILTAVRSTLAMPKDDPGKEETVKGLRKEINTWVATYRREPKVSGRPSYGQTYSVLNALAGHYNSFGPTAPIPKKRLERIQKELDDATLYLSKGR